MREEIAAAVVFLKRLILRDENIPREKVEDFSDSLSAILVEKFRNHWYEDKPAKGQGYRCIRIHPAEPLDPVLEKAAQDSGIDQEVFNVPMELTLWVDPEEVCCRVGDVFSHFFTVACFRDGSVDNQAHTINVEELWERARQQYNQQINITTTRTNHNHNHNHNSMPRSYDSNIYLPGAMPYNGLYNGYSSFTPFYPDNQNHYSSPPSFTPYTRGGGQSPPAKNKNLRALAKRNGSFRPQKHRGAFSHVDRFHWAQEMGRAATSQES